MSKKVFSFLMIPVLVLTLWTLRLTFLRQTGTTIVLPITGYDPRDLIAGHYITFQIDYGKTPLTCGGDGKKTFVKKQKAYLCLETKQVSLNRPEKCPLFIEGICAWGRFADGLNRFYIPQNDADKLDKAVRKGGYGIKISVQKDGKAFIKSLEKLKP